MQLEFPYQIVTFLGKEPNPNIPVYYNDYGWYPQLAIKRRFKLDGITEDILIKELQDFFNIINQISTNTGELIKPEHMPVRVINIINKVELISLHNQLTDRIKGKIISRYPDREGVNYYPHITVEYNGEFVINVDDYTNKTLKLNNAWLLKDVRDENSLAYAKIC